MDLDLQLVVDRLRGAGTGLRSVDAIADLDAAMRGHVAPPQGFVMPLSDAAGPPRGLTGPTRQRVTEEFAVLFVFEALRDDSGAEALTALRGARLAVRGSLVGWIPIVDDQEPIGWVGGQLVDFAGDGRFWWSDEYRLHTHFRSH